ncbi:MAG: hypothetical protein LBC63_08275 [Holophagales bacterium]|jgi:hypothetical protein|nr:hypothetical protein [Holophagales bacterium]
MKTKLFKGIDWKPHLSTLWVGIILLLFQPVMEVIRDFSIKYSGNIFRYFMNIIVTIAGNVVDIICITASGISDLSFYLYLIAFFTIIFARTVYRNSFNVYEKIKTNNQISSIIKKEVADANNEALANNDSPRFIDDETKINMVIEKIVNAVENKIPKQNKIQRSRYKKSFWYLFITPIFHSMFLVFYIWLPFWLKSSFDKNLIIITPYVDTQTINLLKSDWVKMKSFEQYKNINTRIRTIIEQQTQKEIQTNS